MLYNILENIQHGKRYQNTQHNVQINQYNKIKKIIKKKMYGILYDV